MLHFVFDVTVIGSANLDLVVRTERHPSPGETVLGDDFAEYPGGKGLNQAVAAARAGASTSFVGAVGTDDAGRTLRSVAHAERIDLSRLGNDVRHLGRLEPERNLADARAGGGLENAVDPG